MIIGFRLALHKMDCICRAGRKAVPQSVTVIISQELRLPVHHADRTLVAGSGAGSASVAFFLINLYDLAYHVDSPL